MKRALMAGVVGVALIVSSVTAVADEGHDHSKGCDERHPVVVALRAQVTQALSSAYSNLAAVLAAGFVPYFDAVVPYGNPTPWPGGIKTPVPYLENGRPDPETWVKHYIQPDWMNDGDNVNPMRPEALLLDEWDRPIGMMFIADLETKGKELYAGCHPWHKHVDDAAIYAFWAYRYFYTGNSERPSETPPMMHVWIKNRAGTFAHEYPEAYGREGPPPPTPRKCTPSMRKSPVGVICS